MPLTVDLKPASLWQLGILSLPSLVPKYYFCAARTSLRSGLSLSEERSRSSGSTYVEFGTVLKGNFDASVDGATTTQDVSRQSCSSRVPDPGVGSYRGELGARVALKQYRDDALRTEVTHDGKTSYSKNSDNFVTAEFGYLRDTSLVGLKTINLTQNRYVLRVLATPEVPGLPAHMRPSIGMEMTGGFGTGSPKQVKFLYGLTTGAFGLF